MPEIIMIAAVAANGAIGRNNQLLWHLPEDMKFFRDTTAGKTVLMGRKTWESLPPRFRPLPGRRNIVVSRRTDYVAPGAEVFHSLPDAVDACGNEAIVFVIGGAEMYQQAMPMANKLILTELAITPEGDAFFPKVDHAAWQRVSGEGFSSPTGLHGEFVTYKRRTE